MQTRDVLGFVLTPLVLLIAAWLIQSMALWSRLANSTLPWLCTAIAVSILLMGLVCAILQVSPAGIPRRVSVLVVVGVQVILGTGMTVDMVSYHPAPDDWPVSIAEWLGFLLVSSGVFAIARLRPMTG